MIEMLWGAIWTTRLDLVTCRIRRGIEVDGGLFISASIRSVTLNGTLNYED